MASIRKSSSGQAATVQHRDKRIPITLRLDAERYRRLELLAIAENRTPTNFVETAVLRDLEAREESARAISMFVAEDAALAPGTLIRTEGESDERYAERAALMDVLFAIPDSE